MRLRLSFLALAIALTGLTTIPAGAEPTDFWTRQTGSTGQDVASGIAIDADGNRYVVGQTWTGSDTDATVVSYDRYGNLRWEEDISTGGVDVAYAVTVSGQGVYVAGYTTGFVGDSGSNSGGQDAFIRRYDTSGNQVWSNHYGSTANDRLFDIDVLEDGRLVAVGYTTGDLPDVVVSGTPSGGSDRLILVVHPTTGAILDGIQDGTTSHDEARKIGRSGCCTIYVSGYTFGALEGPNGGSADAWVTAYTWNADTTTLTDTGDGWQSGLPGSDSGRGIVAAKGTIYTAFAYDSPEGDRDILLVRWDGSLSTPPNFQPIGAPTYDETVDDLILIDDEPVIIGSSAGDLSGTNDDPGTTDIVATRWIGGQVQDWWLQFGDAGADYGRSAAEGPDGGLTVVGTTEGSIGATNPNPGDLPDNAGRDAIVRSFTERRSDTPPLPLPAWSDRMDDPGLQFAGVAAGASDTLYVAGNGGDGDPDRYFFQAHALVDGSVRWTVESTDPALTYVDIAVGGRAGDPVVILGEYAGSGTGAGVEYVLRAHDPNTGGLLWLTVHGTAANDYPRALAVDETGAIYVTGYTAQSGTTVDTNVFITRHDPSDGGVAWTTTFESDEFDTSNAIDANGGTVFVTGYSYGDLGDAHAGDRDVFVGAFSTSDGTQRWLRQEGEPGFEEGLAVVAQDGALLWAGYTSGSLFGPHAGGSDAVVQSLDPATGTPFWSRQVGEAGSEQAAAITIDQWSVAHVSGAASNVGNTAGWSWFGSIDVVTGELELDGEPVSLADRRLGIRDVDVAADGSLVFGGETTVVAPAGTWIQRRVVRPSALLPATIERHAGALTVTWQPVLGGDITYSVDVDGETMCTTTTTRCLLTGLAADTDLAVEVVATNGLGSTSVQDTTSALRTCDASLTHPFADVPATSFADESVACILAIGVTTGTSATTYSPTNFVTREQMAAFLARLYRYITATNCADPPRFEDVPDTSFAAGDIGCIRALGITTGTSATTYSPADFVTREQMAAFLARLLRTITGTTCSGLEHPFDDVPDASFAAADVGCIYHHGITTGTSATTYSPADRVTREQMAAFLERLYQYLADPQRPAV